MTNIVSEINKSKKEMNKIVTINLSWQEFQRELPYNPAIPVLDICQKKIFENRYSTRIRKQIFLAALFPIASR